MEEYLTGKASDLPCKLHIIVLHSLCSGEEQETALHVSAYVIYLFIRPFFLHSINSRIVLQLTIKPFTIIVFVHMLFIYILVSKGNEILDIYWDWLHLAES